MAGKNNTIRWMRMSFALHISCLSDDECRELLDIPVEEIGKAIHEIAQRQLESGENLGMIKPCAIDDSFLYELERKAHDTSKKTKK